MNEYTARRQADADFEHEERKHAEAYAEGVAAERMCEYAAQEVAAERETFTPAMIEAIYAAWHCAGIDIAGGNWARFVGMLPRPNGPHQRETTA